ncbi:MAG: copper chaperone PCu(A)C [Actinomycetota bacterium]
MRTFQPNREAGRRTWPSALAASIAALVLAACGADDTTSDTAEAATGSGSPLTVEEAWVKAADEGMTAAFGVLANTSDADVRVVGAESPAAAAVELHEVAEVDGEQTMREKDGGFEVPAGSEHVLEPGGDHLMLMDLAGPVQPGEGVDVVLTLQDGSTVELTAQAKDFAGADEDYEPGESSGAEGDGNAE